MKTLYTLLSQDILMVRHKETSSISDIVFIIHPRLLPILLFRISSFLNKYYLGVIAKIVSIINQILFGCDIARSAKIDGGLYLPHPTGVVVGENAIIGRNCILHQGVTLGDRGEEHQGSDPSLGDFIEVGTGAKILGALHIGDYSRIGANSVVLKNFEKASIIVGAPAKCIGFREDKRL